MKSSKSRGRDTTASAAQRGTGGGRAGAAGYDFQARYVALQLAYLLFGGPDSTEEVCWEKKSLDPGKGDVLDVYVDDVILISKRQKIFVQVKLRSAPGEWSAKTLASEDVASQFYRQWLQANGDGPDHVVLRLASNGGLANLQLISQAAQLARTPSELLSIQTKKPTCEQIKTLSSRLSLPVDSDAFLAFLKALQFEQLPEADKIRERAILALRPYLHADADTLAVCLTDLVFESMHASRARSAFNVNSLIDTLAAKGYSSDFLRQEVRRSRLGLISEPPPPDADVPQLKSAGQSVRVDNCGLNFDLHPLWGVERRGFIGVLTGRVDEVHAALKRTERLIDDSLTSNADRISALPILRWWITIRWPGSPDGPSSSAGLYACAEDPNNQHVAWLRTAKEKGFTIGGRVVVPSFLLRVDAGGCKTESQLEFLQKSVASWCTRISENLLPNLPVAIVVVVEGANHRITQALVRHLQATCSPKQWSFIEAAASTAGATLLIAQSEKSKPSGEIEAKRGEHVTLHALERVLLSHPADDDALDAWVATAIAMRSPFPARNWFFRRTAGAPDTRSFRRVCLAIMRAGASADFRQMAKAQLSAYRPMPSDLEAIAESFGAPGPIPFGELSPSQILVALHARLNISLDAAPLPPSHHDDLKCAYWWTFLSSPLSLNSLRAILESRDVTHRLTSGLMNEADHSFPLDPALIDDIAYLRRPPLVFTN